MDKENNSMKLIKWTARLTSAFIIILFAVIMTFSIIEDGVGPIALRDGLMMAFFPVLYTCGALYALKEEFLGGVLMLIAFIMFNVVNTFFSDFLRFDMPFLLMPAILYLIYGYNKDKKN